MTYYRENVSSYRIELLPIARLLIGLPVTWDDSLVLLVLLLPSQQLASLLPLLTSLLLVKRKGRLGFLILQDSAVN